MFWEKNYVKYVCNPRLLDYSQRFLEYKAVKDLIPNKIK